MCTPAPAHERIARSSRVVVNAQEFCDLLVSRRRLTRADEPERGLRGLIDLDSGVRYLSDEVHLARGCRETIGGR
jgi:hypothetical protein